MTVPISDREQQELTRLTDAQAALARAAGIARDGAPKAGEERLLALAYAMLTFGEMLKQASRGVVTQAFSGPIALRDKLAHIPHRKLNPDVLIASTSRAETEILPLIQARIEDLAARRG
ncbi:hypothetical protein [Sphaerimonospora thailandensis]|uniref:Uncharacterized protein n=1 Tax=Sphaerimonospora thailandensis TaxID=795644 RepID=A0A8J3RGH0_9ACTN|nr:hypothetical protein [Sphaerimonospora thailandensis]GIH73437.1 hypothetical protein Mth01_56900 [Sphaerimonospora thailandensis]